MTEPTQDNAETPLQNYGDMPISTSDQDILGVAPFAKALSESIRKMRSPEGVVIGLNGKWGSGKSSIMNLIASELESVVEDEALSIIKFNPWWFRGEEALVLAFLEELYGAIQSILSKKTKKYFKFIYNHISKAKTITSTAAKLFHPQAGEIIGGVFELASGKIGDKTLDEYYKTISNELRINSKKRFVIFVDDIDRLAPNEALAIFRLIKSVGRLPNVIYVLAFDRKLAEDTVARQFPSEGAHYLERSSRSPSIYRHRTSNTCTTTSGPCCPWRTSTSRTCWRQGTSSKTQMRCFRWRSKPPGMRTVC